MQVETCANTIWKVDNLVSLLKIYCVTFKPKHFRNTTKQLFRMSVSPLMHCATDECCLNARLIIMSENGQCCSTLPRKRIPFSQDWHAKLLCSHSLHWAAPAVIMSRRKCSNKYCFAIHWRASATPHCSNPDEVLTFDACWCSAFYVCKCMVTAAMTCYTIKESHNCQRILTTCVVTSIVIVTHAILRATHELK